MEFLGVSHHPTLILPMTRRRLDLAHRFNWMSIADSRVLCKVVPQIPSGPEGSSGRGLSPVPQGCLAVSNGHLASLRSASQIADLRFQIWNLRFEI